jgi:hypothetical protein
LAAGANFRLKTQLGDLDIMQWVAGVENDPAYTALDTATIEGERPGIPYQNGGMKRSISAVET